jgi:hypothetical protein
MTLRKLLRQTVIDMVYVDLGAEKVKIPIADIAGKTPGKTLLIAAGMDGDEYASIEAAYALIEKYQSGDFSGRLVVVPIVNKPGFTMQISKNPLDGLYPKYTYPGKAGGSATERLMHWLSSYASAADAWIDLHGGNMTESITPCLLVYKTGSNLDALAERWYKRSGAEIVLIEPATDSPPALALAPRCLYAIAESGERGERNPNDIARHITYSETNLQRNSHAGAWHDP